MAPQQFSYEKSKGKVVDVGGRVVDGYDTLVWIGRNGR